MGWRARQQRKTLLRMAAQYRAGQLTAIEAMCRVIQISPLPAEMAIEWWVELVYRTDPRNPGWPSMAADALDHLVPV